MKRIISPTSTLAIVTAFQLSLLGANAGNRLNKVTVIPAHDRGEPVVAKTDTDGAIHLLYNTADVPRYAKSTDNGKSC